MSNISTVPSFRHPMQSLQQIGAAWLNQRREQNNRQRSQASVAHASADEAFESTQWAPTAWPDTSLEPRLP